jgi:hypothetical protein
VRKGQGQGRKEQASAWGLAGDLSWWGPLELCSQGKEWVWG